MWTTADPASHGQDAGAGAGRKGATTNATRPEPTAMLIVSSSWSAPDLSSAVLNTSKIDGIEGSSPFARSALSHRARRRPRQPGSCGGGGGAAAGSSRPILRYGPSLPQLKSTAITISAPKARHIETGTGF